MQGEDGCYEGFLEVLGGGLDGVRWGCGWCGQSEYISVSESVSKSVLGFEIVSASILVSVSLVLA